MMSCKPKGVITLLSECIEAYFQASVFNNVYLVSTEHLYFVGDPLCISVSMFGISTPQKVVGLE